MKKMLFSAIAMVVFTLSASAANEGVLTDTDCDLIWELSYLLNRSENKSVKDSRAEADKAKENCEKTSTEGTVSGPKPNVISPR